MPHHGGSRTAGETSGGTFVWQEDVILGNGTPIVGGRHSVDMFHFAGSDQLFLFFPKKRPPGGKTVLQGARCGFLTFSGTCTVPSNWTTPASANAFFPAVAVANVTATDRRVAVSYWNDNASSDGKLELMIGRIPSGTSNFNISTTGSKQIPCPNSSNAYWGDYDAMTVHGDGSAIPLYVRYFTDSTATACTPSTGLPQHVSSFLWLP